MTLGRQKGRQFLGELGADIQPQVGRLFWFAISRPAASLLGEVSDMDDHVISFPPGKRNMLLLQGMSFRSAPRQFKGVEQKTTATPSAGKILVAVPFERLRPAQHQT
jgi:hypothetical protein